MYNCTRYILYVYIHVYRLLYDIIMYLFLNNVMFPSCFGHGYILFLFFTMIKLLVERGEMSMIQTNF